MVLMGKMVSGGFASGVVAFFDAENSGVDYAGKIVVVENLDVNNFVVRMNGVKAIVSEKGGLTAHGAIICREFGVPCVVLPNAATILKSGVRVEIKENGALVVDARVEQVQGEEKPDSFKPIVEGGWVCYRPYQYSIFVNGLRKESFRCILKILGVSDEEVGYKTDERGYWLRGFPQELILNRMMGDRKWFGKVISERKSFYSGFMGWLVDAKTKMDAGISVEEGLKLLEESKEFYPPYMAFLYITNILADRIQEEFYEFLMKNLDRKTAFAYMARAYESNYVKKLLELGIEPASRGKELVFPPPKIVVFKACVNYDTGTELDSEIIESLSKESKETARDFIKYSGVCPLLGRLAEETMVSVRAFRLVINHLLFTLGQELMEKNKISEIGEVENFTAEELNNTLTYKGGI